MGKARNLPRNLRRLLSERGISYTDFGSALGVSTAAISYYCSGKRKPQLDMLFKMADYLGVTIGELVSEEKR